MTISFVDYAPVTFRDKDIFLSHFSRFPQIHSDNTYTNMMCWNHFAHYRFAMIEDNILISSTIDGNTKFRPPIGPRNPAVLHDVFRLAIENGDDKPLVLIDDASRSWIREEFPDLPMEKDRNYFEYVYQREDLAELPGRKYLNIRRHLNKFWRRCSPVVEEIKEKNIEEVRIFLQEWCEWKDCDSEPFLRYEKEAVMFAISYFKELGLSGIMIRVDDKPGAIALFEIMNPKTAVVHFEKALPDCEGIYKAINAETARFLKGRVEFINRESDMGVPGLRTAKTRYRPHHMVEVYYAKKKNLEQIV